MKLSNVALLAAGATNAVIAHSSSAPSSSASCYVVPDESTCAAICANALDRVLQCDGLVDCVCALLVDVTQDVGKCLLCGALYPLIDDVDRVIEDLLGCSQTNPLTPCTTTSPTVTLHSPVPKTITVPITKTITVTQSGKLTTLTTIETIVTTAPCTTTSPTVAPHSPVPKTITVPITKTITVTQSGKPTTLTTIETIVTTVPCTTSSTVTPHSPAPETTTVPITKVVTVTRSGKATTLSTIETIVTTVPCTTTSSTVSPHVTPSKSMTTKAITEAKTKTQVETSKVSTGSKVSTITETLTETVPCSTSSGVFTEVVTTTIYCQQNSAKVPCPGTSLAPAFPQSQEFMAQVTTTAITTELVKTATSPLSVVTEVKTTSKPPVASGTAKSVAPVVAVGASTESVAKSNTGSISTVALFHLLVPAIIVAWLL